MRGGVPVAASRSSASSLKSLSLFVLLLDNGKLMSPAPTGNMFSVNHLFGNTGLFIPEILHCIGSMTASKAMTKRLIHERQVCQQAAFPLLKYADRLESAKLVTQ